MARRRGALDARTVPWTDAFGENSADDGPTVDPSRFRGAASHGRAMSDDTTLACIRVVELVTAYLEGDLDPATRLKLDEHLAMSAPCRMYLEQIRRTIDEVGAAPVGTLPEDTRAHLVEAFRAFHNGGPSRQA